MPEVDALREYEGMFLTLQGDALRHHDGGRFLPTDPAERRAYVRSVFAFIEGMTHATRHVALSLDPSNTVFSLAERALLQEERYELDARGEVRVRTGYHALLRHIRFAFAMLGKVTSSGFDLKVDGAGWQALQHALLLRNRLMHPRSTKDLAVSDADVRATTTAFVWLTAGVVLSLIKTIKQQRARLLALRDRIEESLQDSVDDDPARSHGVELLARINQEIASWQNPSDPTDEGAVHD